MIVMHLFGLLLIELNPFFKTLTMTTSFNNMIYEQGPTVPIDLVTIKRNHRLLYYMHPTRNDLFQISCH